MFIIKDKKYLFYDNGKAFLLPNGKAKKVVPKAKPAMHTYSGDLDVYATTRGSNSDPEFTLDESMKEKLTSYKYATHLYDQSQDMGAFEGCTDTSIVLKLDTSKCDSFENMFKDCKNLTNLKISKLDMSHNQMTINMFSNCSSLASLDLHDVNIPVEVEDGPPVNDITLFNMFNGTSALKQLALPDAMYKSDISSTELSTSCTIFVSPEYLDRFKQFNDEYTFKPYNEYTGDHLTD